MRLKPRAPPRCRPGGDARTIALHGTQLLRCRGSALELVALDGAVQASADVAAAAGGACVATGGSWHSNRGDQHDGGALVCSAGAELARVERRPGAHFIMLTCCCSKIEILILI